MKKWHAQTTGECDVHRDIYEEGNPKPIAPPIMFDAANALVAAHNGERVESPTHYCNKCGWVGTGQAHPDCGYLAYLIHTASSLATPTPQGQSRLETGATEEQRELRIDPSRRWLIEAGTNCFYLTNNGWHIFKTCGDEGLNLEEAKWAIERLSAITRANKTRDEQSAPAAEQEDFRIMLHRVVRAWKNRWPDDSFNRIIDTAEDLIRRHASVIRAPSLAQEKPPTETYRIPNVLYVKFDASGRRRVEAFWDFDDAFSPEYCKDHGIYRFVAAQEKPVEASVEEIAHKAAATVFLQHELSGYLDRRGWGLPDVIHVSESELAEMFLTALSTASPSEDTKELTVSQLLGYLRSMPHNASWLATIVDIEEIIPKAIDAAMSSPSVTQTETSATPPTLSAQGQQSKETGGVDWQDLAIRARTELELLHMNWGLIVKHFGDAKDLEYRETNRNAVCQAIYDAQKTPPSEPESLKNLAHRQDRQRALRHRKQVGMDFNPDCSVEGCDSEALGAPAAPKLCKRHLREAERVSAMSDELWETQFERNSELHYVCSTSDGAPVSDYGFSKQSEAAAFTNAHNSAVRAAVKERGEDTKIVDWLEKQAVEGEVRIDVGHDRGMKHATLRDAYRAATQQQQSGGKS